MESLGAISRSELGGCSSPLRTKAPPPSKSNPATSHSACRAGAGKFKKKEERNMKSRTWMWMLVVSLFAAPAMPVGMAAQDNPTPDHKQKHHQYKLIDMGTFGGPNSFYFSSPVGDNVNNRGTVVGAADTSVQDPYYPNCDTPDCLILRAFQWKNGILTDTWARFLMATAARLAGSTTLG
jgi:hypothetical protein